MVKVNKILNTIKRFEVITNKKHDDIDREILLEEWVRNFKSWKDDHFDEVVEELKKTCAFFPKLADFYKASSQLSRKIDNSAFKPLGQGASADRAKLWVALREAKDRELWDDVLDIVADMEKAGVDQKWTNPLIAEATAKKYNDEVAVLGAYYSASMATGYPLGGHLIDMQKRIIEGTEDVDTTPVEAARHISDAF